MIHISLSAFVLVGQMSQGEDRPQANIDLTTDCFIAYAMQSEQTDYTLYIGVTA